MRGLVNTSWFTQSMVTGIKGSYPPLHKVAYDPLIPKCIDDIALSLYYYMYSVSPTLIKLQSLSQFFGRRLYDRCEHRCLLCSFMNSATHVHNCSKNKFRLDKQTFYLTGPFNPKHNIGFYQTEVIYSAFEHRYISCSCLHYNMNSSTHVPIMLYKAKRK